MRYGGFRVQYHLLLVLETVRRQSVLGKSPIDMSDHGSDLGSACEALMIHLGRDGCPTVVACTTLAQKARLELSVRVLRAECCPVKAVKSGLI